MIGYKFAALLVVALFLGDCDSKIVVTHLPRLPPGTELPKADGMVYALPHTVVRLHLKIDKTMRQPARFAHFAAIFAPDGTPVCEDETCTKEHLTTYALQDGATFSTYGEPDPEEMYMVKFVGGGAIDQNLTMTWNEIGILSSTSATVTNRTGDVVLSALKLAAGLGARTFSSRTLDTAPRPTCEDASRNDYWVLPLLELSSTAADRLKANYCAISSATRRDWNRGRDEDLLRQAVAAYVERVNPLIYARTTILKGNSDSDEPATLLSHIEAEINEQLTVLYLGRAKTVTWDGALDVKGIPESTPPPIPILAVDTTKGICLLPAAEIAPLSKPIPWSAAQREGLTTFDRLDSAECANATVVNLTLQLYPEESKQLFSKIQDVRDGDRSFRYRLAAQVKATLSDAKNTGERSESKNTDAENIYGTGVFSVAQLGKVISLPARRNSKSITYELTFIESTGALQKFTLDSVGILDAATIDALAGAGGTLLDATKEKTEVDKLTEFYQLLKLKDDICTIQQKYNLPCTVQPK